MYDKMTCPSCKARLSVYLGNGDSTSPDVEAVQCGKCGTAFLMGDESNQWETLDIIIISHCEEDDGQERGDFLDNTRPEMIDSFLEKGEWRGQSLSDFLKENAYLETGEIDSPFSEYVVQTAEKSHCPKCHGYLDLLTHKEGSTGPSFYICFNCREVAQVGVGPVKRE